MRDFVMFSANVQNAFENKEENLKNFVIMATDAANRVYTKFSKEDTEKAIRAQFNTILGIDFKSATDMKRRQAMRAHQAEYCALIEDIIVDRMNSGWNTANAAFMQYVEEKNLAEGDKNEFYVKSNALLQVSKYAGDHHDILLSHSIRVA